MIPGAQKLFCGQLWRRLGATRSQGRVGVASVTHTAPSVPRCLFNGQRFPLCSLIKTHAKVSQQVVLLFLHWDSSSLLCADLYHVFHSAGPDEGKGENRNRVPALNIQKVYYHAEELD